MIGYIIILELPSTGLKMARSIYQQFEQFVYWDLWELSIGYRVSDGA